MTLGQTIVRALAARIGRDASTPDALRQTARITTLPSCPLTYAQLSQWHYGARAMAAAHAVEIARAYRLTVVLGPDGWSVLGAGAA